MRDVAAEIAVPFVRTRRVVLSGHARRRAPRRRAQHRRRDRRARARRTQRASRSGGRRRTAVTASASASSVTAARALRRMVAHRGGVGSRELAREQLIDRRARRRGSRSCHSLHDSPAQPAREVADVASRAAEQPAISSWVSSSQYEVDRERRIVLGELGQDLARERAGLATCRRRRRCAPRSRSRAAACDSCRRAAG